MKLYFAYGANLNLDGMAYRCPKAQQVQPYFLEDYRLAFSGVATVRPSPGHSVPGALWNITEECEHSLDMFEGFPSLYRKEVINIHGDDIMFYVMNNDPPGEPHISYFMTIARGYESWGLPLEYLYNAVEYTQEKQYDMHWSTSTIGFDYDHAGMETMVPVESGHGLR
jgi:gamma-glutamylcyclotransferase (GGCT)/AIG2-like uncharacterized protein YtfP